MDQYRLKELAGIGRETQCVEYRSPSTLQRIEEQINVINSRLKDLNELKTLLESDPKIERVIDLMKMV